MSTDNRLKLGGVGLIVILLIGALVGWLFPIDVTGRVRALWLVEMALLFLFALVAGKAVTGFWKGLFIDERNKASLSRLQLVLWTALLLSAYLTAALLNLRRNQPDPLSITLDPTLWGLMGISTVSLVGSPLVKNSKKEQPTNESEKTKTLGLLGVQGANVSAVKAEGQLLVNAQPEEASWIDLFKGEEVGNAANLDLGKVQMFFFTIIVWFTYASALSTTTFNAQVQKIGSFPEVTQGMLALLAISHAGYLANKAVPHTAQPAPAQV